MAEYTTKLQKNQGWNLSWSALDRYPMIAKRRFPTLADAQAFVDDVAPGASATEGIIIAVLKDSVSKNNGVYYVSKVANNDPEYGEILEKGELVKVGGTETETAENYSAAVELSKTLAVGQLIKVTKEEIIGEGEEAATYQKGFYIVESAGVISALSTSTGSDDELGALKSRIDSIESDYVTEQELADAINAIAHPEDLVKDVKYGDETLLVDGIAKLDDFAKTSAVTEAINNAVSGKADSSAVYTKEEADEKFLDASAYTKYDDTEVRGLISSETQEREAAINGIDGRLNTLESINHDAYIAADKTVLAGAKEYADGLNTAMGERVATLEGLDKPVDVVYNDNTKFINLVDESGNTIGNGFDASAFIVDGMLQSVQPVAGEGNKGKFVFTFNVKGEDGDAKSFIVDFSQFIDVYTAGNGLSLTGNEFSVNFNVVASKDSVDTLSETVSTKAAQTDLEALAARVEKTETGITKSLEDIATISGAVDTKAAKTDLEALAQLVGTAKTDDAEASGLFAALDELASLVDTKANAEDVYTKEEADEKFLTGVTIDTELNATSTNAVENKAVFAEFVKVRDEITSAVTGDVSAALTNYAKKDQLNTINNIALYGDSADEIQIIAGDAATIETNTANKTIAFNSKVSTDSKNAISIKDDGLFVQSILIDGDDPEELTEQA